VNTVDDKIRAATRAEAATLREVRPLRLPPASGEQPRARARRARRFRAWIAPVTAAAAVVALAISLVIVRDISNGRVVPPAGPLPAAAAVPQYYVTLYTPPSAPVPPPCRDGTPPTQCPPSTTKLLVGNTFTGARLALVAPPAGTYFSGVVAADDDRTFVIDTTTMSEAGTRTWYLLRISPGAGSAAGRSAASVTRLTKLPIPALPDGIAAIALSGSGSELAVALQVDKGARSELRIYSVTTGRLLRAWSTTDPNAFGNDSYYAEQSRALAWIDGDRDVAFFASWNASDDSHSAWRQLDIATGGSDLMADSTVIWSSMSSETEEYPPGCEGWLQAISPDGKTILCASVTIARGTDRKPLSWRVEWLGYSVPAGAVRTLYQATFNSAQMPFFHGLWTSASGGTSIVEWGPTTNNPKSVHVGVLSHGTLHQLPVPPETGTVAPSITWLAPRARRGPGRWRADSAGPAGPRIFATALGSDLRPGAAVRPLTDDKRLALVRGDRAGGGVVQVQVRLHELGRRQREPLVE